MIKICKVIIVLVYFISGKSFAQCLTPSVVPYYESFQGITVNDQLPPCWAVSNTTTCLTFASTSKYAAFYYTPSGNNYFYSNAIQLQAGITYSMASWYKIVNLSPSNSWTEFSMFIGQNQNTTGLVNVAAAFNPVNASYSALSNTFIVSVTGTYYAAIKGASNGSGGPQHIYWDDFSITIPCTNAYNTPTVSITANSYTICSGKQTSLTATGANTYTWNTGVTGPVLNTTPLINIIYTVTGTSTLTNCNATATVFIKVNPSPNISVTASNPFVCLGSSVTLSVSGQNSYSWSTGQQGAQISISPSLTTIYTVTATNSFSCSKTTSIQIIVYPLPVISVTKSVDPSCIGQEITLSASGAGSLQWVSVLGSMSGNLVLVTPAAISTTFIVIGINSNNCMGQTNYVLNVNACTGLKNISEPSQNIKIYPNPGNGEFILETDNFETKTIIVTDLVGKVVFTCSSSTEKTLINISNYARGIYQVKISSGNQTNYSKVVKQ